MIPQLSRIAAVLKGAFGFVTANRDPVTGGIGKVTASGRDVALDLRLPAKTMVGCASYSDTPSNATPGAATTYELIRSFARQPIAAQVVYRHNCTTAPSAMKFMVGAVDSPSGAAQNLVPVTWGGAAALSGTAVAASSQFQTLQSDIVPVAAVARTDAQSGYLLALRVLTPGDAKPITYSALSNGTLPTAGQIIANGRQKSGDFVTSNQAGFDITTFNSPVAIGDLLVYYADGTSDIFLGVGDSITSGQFSTTGFDGWTRQTVALAKEAGKQIDYFNAGLGGQPSTTYLAAALPLIASLRPKIASYAMYSPNESIPDQSGLPAAKARVLQFIAACRAAGTLPVFPTPVPKNNRNAQEQAYILACRSWLQSYVSGVLGYPVIDLLAAMGSQADPTVFAAGMGAADGAGVLHPSQAGYAAGAAAAYSVLSPYF